LTTAAEELDALPEDLTSHLNKLLHDIDEADKRNANLVTMQSETNMLPPKGGSSRNTNLGRTRRPPRRQYTPMGLHPVDAQRIPVSLGSLRMKLGEIAITTLLRLRNISDEPLRLKSGRQLKSGNYIKSLSAVDPNNHTTVCYHLYPGTEIPPRTEIVVAARSGGVWLPTSGIEGEIVYTNRDESWIFCIRFRNQLFGNVRKCPVEATHVGRREPSHSADDEYEKAEAHQHQYWEISKDELDRKANNEVVISIDALNGGEAKQAARQSLVSLKKGLLLKNSNTFGLRLQWHPRWFELTPRELVYSQDPSSTKRSRIAIKDIHSVREGSDLVKENVFEIRTRMDGSKLYKLCAPSPVERSDWIQKISMAAGMDVADYDYLGGNYVHVSSTEEESDTTTAATAVKEDNPPVEDGFECVQSETGLFSVVSI